MKVPCPCWFVLNRSFLRRISLLLPSFCWIIRCWPHDLQWPPYVVHCRSLKHVMKYKSWSCDRTIFTASRGFSVIGLLVRGLDCFQQLARVCTYENFRVSVFCEILELI